MFVIKTTTSSAASATVDGPREELSVEALSAAAQLHEQIEQQIDNRSK